MKAIKVKNRSSTKSKNKIDDTKVQHTLIKKKNCRSKRSRQLNLQAIQTCKFSQNPFENIKFREKNLKCAYDPSDLLKEKLKIMNPKAVSKRIRAKITKTNILDFERKKHAPHKRITSPCVNTRKLLPK